jgi:hypothetical protein
MKTLIILVLLFNGTLLKEEVVLPAPTEVYNCLLYGDMYVDTIATYKEFDDPMLNGYYLNDKRGTIQGYYCE